MKTFLYQLLVGLFCLAPPLTVFAMKKKERFMICGACIAMIDEIGWHIATTDPKKKVQVGSFRINPSGNQNTHEIPYARSELHLTELLEIVCNGMRNYIVYKDEKLQKKYWIRKTARDGAPISKKNTLESDELSKLLKFKCESLVEEHEEEIIRIYSKTKEDREAEKLICVDLAGVCRQLDLDQWLMAQSKAVMDGIQELQDKEKEEEEGEGDEEIDEPDEEKDEYDAEAESAADDKLAQDQDNTDSDIDEEPVTEEPPTGESQNKDEL